jgi:polar amino acid transport system permease protein
MLADLTVIFSALPSLLEGATVTLGMSFLAVILGILVGVALAIALQAGGRIMRAFVRFYVSFARGTPLFVQILIVFFLLPAVGIDIPRFYAGVIALSLNSGAYISEMIRGGLTAIRPGQIEAARALAMPRALIWRHIVLPQVFTLILPPLTVEFIALLKGSSLVSIIGVKELTRSGYLIVSATYEPIDIWVTVGMLYFVLCFALGALTRQIERATFVYRSQ